MDFAEVIEVERAARARAPSGAPQPRWHKKFDFPLLSRKNSPSMAGEVVPADVTVV
jgi:hypothetical protein